MAHRESNSHCSLWASFTS